MSWRATKNSVAGRMWPAGRNLPTLAINNCQGERSFSTLSRVKNHQQAMTSQPRLAALALMCIESELLRNLDFAEVIEEFAVQ